MRTVLRRSLVMATLLALLLGVAGFAGPVDAASRPTATKVAGINVDTTTIPQLEALMDRHRLTSVQLVQFYLHRITKLNPLLHAVIRTNPSALALARAADAARRAGDDRPLLGIPIIVKDNIDTTGMPTTAGSWALAGSTPSDAFIVQRLKAAGAIILAKANLSEWANFRSGPSSSGWSGIGGQTNMPYQLDRNPCGSSSGSGVAAAADLAVAAVGTETDGSVVCPSGANGVVGIKPTLGLLSRSGIVPISAEQDSAGPIARNVTDAAVLLGAMTGVDSNDPATADQAGHARHDYTPFLNSHALEGARIGIWHDEGTHDPASTPWVDSFMATDVAGRLQAAGATTVDVSLDLSDANNAEFPALLCEFKSDIASYLGTHTTASYPKTLQDLIDFDTAHPELEGPWNDLIFDFAQATNGRDADCAAARATATGSARRAIDELLASLNLDAIVAPTNGPAWVTDLNPEEGDLGGDFSTFVGSSNAAAISGYADMTVPGGYRDGLPIGITFIGNRWDEPEIIALGYAWEQATHVRVPPQFLGSPPAAESAGATTAPVKHAHPNAKGMRRAELARDARWGATLR
jgi:amidase